MKAAHPQIERIQRLAARVERFVPWVALGAAPVGVFLVLRSQRAALAEIDWTVPWHALVVSALAFAVAPLLQGVSPAISIRGLST